MKTTMIYLVLLIATSILLDQSVEAFQGKRGEIEAASGTLTEAQRASELAPFLSNGWEQFTDKDAIEKHYLFKDFNQAFGFMTRAALKAEKMDHHPEWRNNYNLVVVILFSDDVNGLSERDITMAKFMDGIETALKGE